MAKKKEVKKQNVKYYKDGKPTYIRILRVPEKLIDKLLGNAKKSNRSVHQQALYELMENHNLNK